MTGRPLPIAIIGAGFSGTMTALHILSRTAARPILLCERGDRFARGIAYDTEETAHLLNVRASNMSAFADRPGHFTAWLSGLGDGEPGICHTPAGTFVSRALYGRYLASLLRDSLGEGDGAARLILVPDEVVACHVEGEAFRLVLAGGLEHWVAGAVLAIGNLLPPGGATGPYIADPWSAPFAEGLAGDDPVVVLGSGLTMVDVALRLRSAGFQGRIIAVSRRGLIPQTHAPAPARPVPTLMEHDRRSVVRLLNRVRREAAADAEDQSWRSVVDSLRPLTSDLWQGLGHDEQQRFLRHARPWWDSHRHRTAPPVGEAVQDLIRAGSLDVRAGSIEHVDLRDDHALVTIRPRGSRETVIIRAQRVINATGPTTPDKAGNPVVAGLIEVGLARMDRHRLGLDITPDFCVVGAHGEATPGLWALGPIGRGVLWECIAVPDIRPQAARVAEAVAAWCDGRP